MKSLAYYLSDSRELNEYCRKIINEYKNSTLFDIFIIGGGKNPENVPKLSKFEAMKIDGFVIVDNMDNLNDIINFPLAKPILYIWENNWDIANNALIRIKNILNIPIFTRNKEMSIRFKNIWGIEPVGEALFPNPKEIFYNEAIR